jgi:anti-sigma regulatory factor (Ser/Thr protein kinase)
MRRLVRQDIEFVIENDLELVASMVQYFQDTAFAMGVCDETDRMRIGVALQEALTNASFHGNLEMSSELRESDHRDYYELAQKRAGLPPWSTRRIYVTSRFTANEVEFRIRDEGPGFNPNGLPNPTEPANLDRASGRGLLLIHSFMDEVRHNESGNEVTLIKRRKNAKEGLVPDQTPGTDAFDPARQGTTNET